MSARSVSLGEMFRWIPDTFGLVFRNFGAMAGAALLTLLVIVVMMLPFFGVVFFSMKGLGSPDVPTMPSMGPIVAGYVLMLVIGMVLTPPVFGGWFRMCNSAASGSGASAMQIFGPFRDSSSWIRLVCFALLGMLMYLVVGGLFGLAFWSTFAQVMQMQMAQMGGMPQPMDPALAVRIVVAYLVVLPVMFVLQFVYMTGMAEVALRPTGAVAAFRDAFVAVLRNLLKLAVFVFVVFVGCFVVLFLVALVLGIVFAILAAISPAIGVVLMLLFEVALMIVIYPLMFSGNYFAWKSMMSD